MGLQVFSSRSSLGSLGSMKWRLLFRLKQAYPTDDLLKQRMRKGETSFQNTLWNSPGRPSIPGDLLGSIIFNASKHFFSVNGPSHFCLSISLSEGCSWSKNKLSEHDVTAGFLKTWSRLTLYIRRITDSCMGTDLLRMYRHVYITGNF